MKIYLSLLGGSLLAVTLAADAVRTDEAGALLAKAHAAEPPAAPAWIVDMGGPGQKPLPIALPTPKGGNAAATEFWSVVQRDLQISGWFEIIDPKAYLEPATAGIRFGEFAFTDWRPIGAAGLAKTSLTTDAKGLHAEVWVYDVAGGQKMGAKAFAGTSEGVRTLAHRVADEIIRLLANQRSFFDTRFAYAAKSAGGKEIYMMDADGMGKRQVTKNGSINLGPEWNRSGSAIAFTSYVAGNPDLYVADLGKGQIRRVSSRSGINTGGAFSPGGEKLALTMTQGGDSDIYLIDSQAGKELARLTREPGIDVSPSWSPDGSRIAFVSERSGGPQIYVMNADGSGAKRVTFSGSYNTDPSWSPKGDKIAFVGREGNFDVFTVRVDGSGMERITQGKGDNEDPCWDPDGNYLAFSSTREGGSHIWIFSADGIHQVKITSGGGGYTNPSWSNHLSW